MWNRTCGRLACVEPNLAASVCAFAEWACAISWSVTGGKRAADLLALGALFAIAEPEPTDTILPTGRAPVIAIRSGAGYTHRRGANKMYTIARGAKLHFRMTAMTARAWHLLEARARQYAPALASCLVGADAGFT